MLPILNLPPLQARLQESDGKIWIFDVIRKKFVVLTPEEWVRQHFVNYLIIEQYPKSLFKIEGGLAVNELRRRSDLVIFNRLGKAWMLVECKNPLIAINQATLDQVGNYNTTIQAKYVVVTNGLEHFYFETNWEEKTIKRLEALPAFE
jgi:Type I restriction enzyme R protein N terminus (HSDR_N)